jgi:hypothetical protein
MLLTDLLPPDVTAATLEMLDAMDVLRTFRAVPTIALPRGWEYQAHRPLREIVQRGFGVVGVPLRLWPTCPTLPNGLVRLWHDDDLGVAVYEDIRGSLYRKRTAHAPFHCWERDDASSNLLRLLSRVEPARLRAMRECDPSNLYDYDAPYQT